MSNNKTALVPRLRFPEFRYSGEWEISSFETFIKLYRGSSPRPIQKFLTKKDGVNWIKIGDTKNAESFKIRSVEEQITHEGAQKSRFVKVGELILANSMSFGKTYEVEIDGCIYDGWFVLREYEEYFDKNFLLQQLNSDNMQKQYLALAAGGIVQNISSDIVYSTVIKRPTLEEQQKIAACLSSIDDIIAAEDKKLEALGAHKRGLMQKVFPAEGKTLPEWRFQEFRGSGEWVISPLSEVCENLDSRRIPITEKDRKKGFTPYYGASGIVDYVDGFIFDEVLLCVSEDGANLVARTYPIAFIISGKTWVNNHAHVLKFQNSNTQVMVKNYINSINLEDFLTGMAQPKLNRAKLDIIPIPLPNEKEQEKIADCLSSIDDLITEQTKKIEALRTHKRGLLQGLFPSIEEVGE